MKRFSALFIALLLWAALEAGSAQSLGALAQVQEITGFVTDPLPNGGLFILGEPIRLFTSSTPAWVRYRLTDAYGEADWTVNGAVYEGEGKVVPAQPSGSWLVLPTDALTRYGLYRLDVTTNLGEAADLRIGLVDPVVRLGEHNSSPVGFILAIDPYRDFAVQLALLGIKWVHFDVPVDNAMSVLYALQPEVQDFVDRALANDITPIFKLIGGEPPGWNNLSSDFYQNLRRVAQTYRGKVRYWIVGNEIDGCGWWRSCNFDTYVTFLRNIAQIVRSVDPQAKILAADLYQGDSPALRRMLAEEQADPSFNLFDVLSVHYLEEGDGEELGPDGCCGSIHTYRQVMGEYGISKPIWNTEALSPLVGGLHWSRNQTSYFRGGDVVPFLSPAKTIVGNRAVGAEKVFFYSYNYDQNLLDGEDGLKRTLTERALAVRALADQLQTAMYLGRLAQAPPYIEGHWYRNGLEMILVIWSNESSREAEATLKVNAEQVLLFDPLGNLYPLRTQDGKVKFRIHYEPQYVRGFTDFSEITFGDGQNDSPRFVSAPITMAVVGRRYTYLAQAYDSEPTGMPNALIPLTYSLLQRPAGMSIDALGGWIEWKPTVPGKYSVTAQASDPQGRKATQTWEITVVSAGQNVPPQILTLPRTVYGVVGAPFVYNVNAWDANGDEITYRLTQGPPWLRVDQKTGFIDGIPLREGIFPVTVRAEDTEGAYAEQSFSLFISGSTYRPNFFLYLPICAKP
ncbi:MAG: putative Ig domain-containing protein [Anaerolineales bacterium]|nr:putative Ig domain-containing protein [Anaerolineales bacterium]MDW8447157.1 putative Ig domain-containing protein [Anaerolineales bacterium]